MRERVWLLIIFHLTINGFILIFLFFNLTFNCILYKSERPCFFLNPLLYPENLFKVKPCLELREVFHISLFILCKYLPFCSVLNSASKPRYSNKLHINIDSSGGSWGVELGVQFDVQVRNIDFSILFLSNYLYKKYILFDYTSIKVWQHSYNVLFNA